MSKAKIVIISIISIFILCSAWLIYAINYEVATIDTKISSEQKYTLKLQQIGMPGFPFGNANAKIIMYKDDGEILEHSMVVGTDGG